MAEGCDGGEIQLWEKNAQAIARFTERLQVAITATANAIQDTARDVMAKVKTDVLT